MPHGPRASANSTSLGAVPCGYPNTDFNHDTKPDYRALQREHAPNSDLVHEQQRFSLRRLYPDSSGWLERDRCRRISIVTATSITRCSTPVRSRRQSGISPGSRLSEASLARLCPAAGRLVATADFNGDCKPDYVLYKASTRQTAVWYMNNNVLVSGESRSDSAAWLDHSGSGRFRWRRKA